MKKLRIIFFGTPEFSATILKGLLKFHPSPYYIVAVVTQPDRPAGRRQIPTPSPVKLLAQKHKIKILTPETLDKNFQFSPPAGGFNFQLAILTAYAKIIPQKLLKLPKFGFLNIHPSLLPKYRGSSPVEFAILNGEKETGVTIIKMDEKIDHGPIISQAKLPIAKTDTKASLTKKLAQLAKQLLLTTLPHYLNYQNYQNLFLQKHSYLFGDGRPQKGKAKFFLPPKAQDHKETTYTKILTRDHGKIDWSKSPETIERMIRAFHPWPGTWTEIKLKVKSEKLKVKRLKILSAHLEDGKLVLDRVQLEGKKAVSFEEFKKGYPNSKVMSN